MTTLLERAASSGPAPTIVGELAARFGGGVHALQPTADGIPTLWSDVEHFRALLRYAKHDAKPRFRMLLDLTAIDERLRTHRDGQPAADFTVVYHLMSFEANADLRIKVPLQGETPSIPTITDLWLNANWYEREVWDLFGIEFAGHPNLRRILLPPTWVGHPLRKDHPARRTEMG
ncbi:MAG: NADH-quinone oxidoreductase subunit C/D, partial [Betaproteobacteria bacterium]|nr:NADH-quinone oxidoreductase subunit C/D [Betaproteobacteria bacterium]